MAENVENIQSIFLNDGKIIYWDNQPKTIAWSMVGAYTEIIKFLGIDTLNKEVGNYSITASAAKYVANIARNDASFCEDAREFAKQRAIPEILFEGAIQIYVKGIQIGNPIGKGVEGYVLKSNEHIWCAQLITKQLYSKKGLEIIVFGENNSEENKIKRVEEIIRGYRVQEGLVQEVLHDRASFESDRSDGRCCFD